MNSKKKHFLFLYSKLATGGVETLIVRMANWLTENGHSVDIVLIQPDKLDRLLSKSVNIKYLGTNYYLLYNPALKNLVLKKKYIEKFDVIYSFEATGLFLSLILANNARNNVSFFSGVYQPNEYISYSGFEANVYKKVMSHFFTPDKLFFMNIAVKNNVEKNLCLQFPTSKLWPLPVDSSNYLGLKRAPKKYKIVSIGRLVDFKSYSYIMVNVIKDLVTKGFDVTYDIYGEGALFKAVSDKIVTENMQNYIFLKGTLDYKNFSEVMKEAYLFIGMGTSLIEASMCGVPSLVAIVENPLSTTYGLSYQIEDHSCGEISKTMKEKNFLDEIIDLFNLDDNEYSELCEKSKQWSLYFETNRVMKEFIDLTSIASNKGTHKKLPLSLEYKYFFSKIFKTYLKSKVRSFAK